MVLNMDKITAISIGLAIAGVMCVLVIVAFYFFSAWFGNAIKDANDSINDAHRRCYNLEDALRDEKLANEKGTFSDLDSEIKIPWDKRWKIGNVWFGSHGEGLDARIFMWCDVGKVWCRVAPITYKMNRWPKLYNTKDE